MVHDDDHVVLHQAVEQEENDDDTLNNVSTIKSERISFQEIENEDEDEDEFKTLKVRFLRENMYINLTSL